MRVLMVSHRFPPDAVAGVERYTESLAQALAEGGDEVAVLCRRPGPGPVRPLRESPPGSYEVVRLTGGGVDRDRFLHLADALDAPFGNVLDDFRPDVVHVNHLVDLSPRFLWLARRAGAAVVMTLHDFWMPCPRITLRRPDGALCGGPEGGMACATHCFPADRVAGARRAGGEPLMLRALYFRRLLDVPDGLLCPSRFVADWFRAWGLEPGRIRALPNGIRMPRAAVPGRESGRLPTDDPVEAAPRRLTLAILGAVVPHKGHHIVIEALTRAGIGPVDVVVHGPVGDAAYARALREAAIAVPDLRLRLCGPYDPSDLSLLLEDVDVLLAPSVWPETFCLVIREALVRGVPAITTKLGALPDAIEDGVSGFLYAHDRPDELAALLGRLRNERGLLTRLSDGARAARVTTLAEHAREVRAAYVEALETRRLNAPRAAAAEAELAAIARALGWGAAPEAYSAAGAPAPGVASAPEGARGTGEPEPPAAPGAPGAADGVALVGSGPRWPA